MVTLPDVVPPPSSDPKKAVLTVNVLLLVPPWRVPKPEKVSREVCCCRWGPSRYRRSRQASRCWCVVITGERVSSASGVDSVDAREAARAE